MKDEEDKRVTIAAPAIVPVRDVVELDGFSDFSRDVEEDDDGHINTSSYVIQGVKLKFNDPHWFTSTGNVDGKLLTVVGVRKVVNKWGLNNKPLITQILPPGEKFPDFKELNAK